MLYYMNKDTVALFACDLLTVFVNDLLSIMITHRVKYEDYCVSIATSSSSEDTVKDWVQNNYGEQVTTSAETT